MKLITILAIALAATLAGCAAPNTGTPEGDAAVRVDRKHTAHVVARGVVRFLTGDIYNTPSIEEQVFGNDQEFR